MLQNLKPTRILFVDNDEESFQVKQCVARVLDALPPIELFHARDATEALSMLDNLKPDVIVLDDELPAERDLLIDSLAKNHPPIVLRTETNLPTPATFTLDKLITYIPKNESLEGIHHSLMLITAIGVKATNQKNSQVVH